MKYKKSILAYKKVKKTIESCNTLGQLYNAKKMIVLFSILFFDIKSTMLIVALKSVYKKKLTNLN